MDKTKKFGGKFSLNLISETSGSFKHMSMSFAFTQHWFKVANVTPFHPTLVQRS